MIFNKVISNKLKEMVTVNNVTMSVCSWVPVTDTIGIAINGMMPIDDSMNHHYYCLRLISG